MDPDTEDRVSRASQRMSRGSHYRDSTRMSSRISFVQLVSDLQHNKKPEGEAMRYATRRRSPTSTNSMLARPPAAVLGALQELIAAICLHPEWEREDILECLEGACRGMHYPRGGAVGLDPLADDFKQQIRLRSSETKRLLEGPRRIQQAPQRRPVHARRGPGPSTQFVQRRQLHPQGDNDARAAGL